MNVFVLCSKKVKIYQKLALCSDSCTIQFLNLFSKKGQQLYSYTDCKTKKYTELKTHLHLNKRAIMRHIADSKRSPDQRHRWDGRCSPHFFFKHMLN